MTKTGEQFDYVIRYLVSKSLEGSIAPEEVLQLDQLIIENPRARRYYVEYLHLHATLRKILQQDPEAVNVLEDEVLDGRLWEELAMQEQTAESIQIAGLAAPAAILPAPTPFVAAQKSRKISRFSMFSFAASIAAVLLVILYIKLVPLPNPVVATLDDSINVRWADTRYELQNGSSIRAETQYLDAGLISMTFDSGVKVVVEGPAVFTPVTVNKMRLERGKAFAHVPNTAIGFVIDTPGSSIVDLGTEFGVAVDTGGGSEVHVYKGKVNLVAGRAAEPKTSEILQQHEARKVDADDGAIRTAEFKKYLFAQAISSKENLVEYGKPVTLASLTDLALGGNGYGTSQETSQVYAVNNGQTITDYTGQYRTLSSPYQKISSNPFIDGVFVPNGSNQVISSEGHVFAECPATSGLYFYDLFFDKNSKYPPTVQALYQKKRNLKFGSDFVFMHSNLGVTFDLDAVRGQFPNQFIRRFQTTAGTLSGLRGYTVLPAEQLSLNYTEFDVWIVVDGQLRARAEKVHWDSLVDLDVSLKATDRFLSVVVTDGGVIRSPGNNENHYDLCGLSDMRLEMEPTE